VAALLQQEYNERLWCYLLPNVGIARKVTIMSPEFEICLSLTAILAVVSAVFVLPAFSYFNNAVQRQKRQISWQCQHEWQY